MNGMYDITKEPSKYLASRLDSFMHLFSFIREATEEDLEKLPITGFRLMPSDNSSVEKVLSNTLDNFPYFMLTRVFPYFHYYYDYKYEREVVLVIVYLDYVVNYVLDVSAMQMSSPVNISDLQSCREEIQKVPFILNLTDSLVEICMNQSIFPRESLKELL